MFGHGSFSITGPDESTIREAVQEMAAFLASNARNVDVVFEFVDWSD